MFRGEAFISRIALGELYYGARKSGNVKANVEKINDFSANTVIIPCDLKTSWYYGIIKTVLKIKGKPIPENDIWVTAIAQQYDPRHSSTRWRYTGNTTLGFLNGTWAPGSNYMDKIIQFANQIYGY